jgi:hypothetical protein
MARTLLYIMQSKQEAKQRSHQPTKAFVKSEEQFSYK